jgi:hypothetical protein
MHLFNMATLVVVLTLAGVGFSVSAFVNPAASRLEPESQLKMLSRSALVLGKVMPVWYSVCPAHIRRSPLRDARSRSVPGNAAG